MMVINNNIPALTTYGIVNNTSNSLQKSIQKLSTGLRINSAADDAAGLSISEKMRAQINGLDRAVANAQDGISLIQTAEGALTETHSILQRMRELSVQAANDTLTQQDRSYIQEEVDLLRDEIDHIGNTTTFNTKKLLNGDAAVLWSSDNLNTKAIVNGGIRNIDQFGQKSSAEGNYKISILGDPGDAHVQKTDIFKVKHTNVEGKNTLGSETGKSDALADEKINMKDGANLQAREESQELLKGHTYDLASLGAATASDVEVTRKVDAGSAFNKENIVLIGATGSTNTTFDLVIEITNVTHNSPTGSGTSSFTYNIVGYKITADGAITSLDKTGGTVTSSPNVPATALTTATSSRITNGLTFTQLTREEIGSLKVGDKIHINGSGNTTGSGTGRTQLSLKDITGAGSSNEVTREHKVNATLASNGSVTVAFVTLNEDTGSVTKHAIKVNFTEEFKADDLKTAHTIGSFGDYKIGDVAGSNVRLRDLDKFWDSQGNFLIEDPQTITITQGDGKTAKVTLYAHDTLEDVQKKLNKAIGDDLGQKNYIKSDDTEGANKFAVFVDHAEEGTSESVRGTFIIRSIVPGSSGVLNFASKNEDVLNALSLNTIQKASETSYTVNIEDAHTGKKVVTDEKITGNVLVGKLHPNIDVEFDAMTGIKAKWNDETKAFDIGAEDKAQETILHIADNTTVFQIGANSGDDMGINIGDMRSHALGLDKVLVTDRASASRSITVIDNAIDKVSTQRAKLGAYQNRLEHTMTNLATSSENLSAAESRIRDTDMAKEMMNFTKLQIMLQAGTSMLTQANQLPQNVLSLIR